MLQDKIVEELKQIPEQKMSELYDLIHYFRLGLESESGIENSGGHEISLVDQLLDNPVRVKASSPMDRDEIYVR